MCGWVRAVWGGREERARRLPNGSLVQRELSAARLTEGLFLPNKLLLFRVNPSVCPSGSHLPLHRGGRSVGQGWGGVPRPARSLLVARAKIRPFSVPQPGP